jgi:hypothetical protein
VSTAGEGAGAGVEGEGPKAGRESGGGEDGKDGGSRWATLVIRLECIAVGHSFKPAAPTRRCVDSAADKKGLSLCA